jgi:CDP-4-dehydro-6-deoxyglucose reductase, E1
MDEKLQSILDSVKSYIDEKHAAKKWVAGQDWVQYAGPYFDSNEFVASVKTLLNEWLILGADATSFENKFPEYLGKKYGVVVNSGSSANLLMIASLVATRKIRPVTKVIVPVAGFPTTLNPTLQYGLKPIFVDIDLDTLNLNLDQVEDVASNAEALMFAHVLGNPPNMDRLMDIVNKHGLTLLEDCCDALGSTYNGRPLGSFGDMASMSFYPAHHITGGEGGFVAVNNHDVEKVIRSLRDWGRGCFCQGQKAGLSPRGACGKRFSKWLPSLPDEIFDHKYVYDHIGYNLKPIEVQCSMLLQQLDKIPTIIAKRKENYDRLMSIFEPYENEFLLPRATPNSDPAWFAFPITIKDGSKIKRSTFCQFLEANKIQTRNYFGGNLLLQPAYRHLDIEKNAHTKYPVATKVTTDTFFLGTSPVITSDQLDYVKSIVDTFMQTSHNL